MFNINSLWMQKSFVGVRFQYRQHGLKVSHGCTVGVISYECQGHRKCLT